MKATVDSDSSGDFLALLTTAVLTTAVLTTAALTGCGGAGPLPPENPKEKPDKPAPVVPVMVSHQPKRTAPSPLTTRVSIENVGFQLPAAAVYVPDQDIYLLSNVHGQPHAEDGNGFVAKLGADGHVENLRFIDGSQPGSKLNAPRGMAVVKGLLYVADLNFVRSFDVRTGAPRQSVEISGASVLSAAASDEDNNVFVVNSNPAAEKPNPELVVLFRLSPNGEVTPVAKYKDVGDLVSIAVGHGGLWGISESELFKIDNAGQRVDVQKIAAGGLSGMTFVPDGQLLLASQGAGAVLRGKPGEAFQSAVEDAGSVAQISFDLKRQRVLIPRSADNKLEALSIQLSSSQSQ